MNSKTVNIPNISCGHCTSTIELEVSELAGVSHVKADIDSRNVTINWDDPATWSEIEALLVEIEYPAAG